MIIIMYNIEIYAVCKVIPVFKIIYSNKNSFAHILKSAFLARYIIIRGRRKRITIVHLAAFQKTISLILRVILIETISKENRRIIITSFIKKLFSEYLSSLSLLLFRQSLSIHSSRNRSIEMIKLIDERIMRVQKIHRGNLIV